MDPEKLIINPSLADDFSYKEASGFLKKIKKLLISLAEPTFIEMDPEKSNADLKRLIVVGDTHGDFFTTKSIIDEFFLDIDELKKGRITAKEGYHILFIGDYVDRAPKHCRNGSFINVMLVFAMKLSFPDKVTLLRGNHESFEVAPCSPYNLPDDLYKMYGEQGYELLEQFRYIFRLMPLMLRTSSGLLAVHGGVFREPKSLSELKNLDRNSLDVIGPTTWAEPREFCAPRMGIGEIYNFNEKEYRKFMTAISANVMIRGHTPNLVGTAIYGKSCLTLFSTQSFLHILGERGIGVVEVPLDSTINSVSDLILYIQTRGNWLPVSPKSHRKK